MNWMLPDPPSHKAGHSQQYSIIHCKQYIQDWAQAGPEDTSKLYEQVTQILMAPTHATLLLLSQLTPLAPWGVPYDQLTKEDFRPGV